MHLCNIAIFIGKQRQTAIRKSRVVRETKEHVEENLKVSRTYDTSKWKGRAYTYRPVKQSHIRLITVFYGINSLIPGKFLKKLIPHEYSLAKMSK